MPDTTPALVRRVLARFPGAMPKRLKLRTWHDATGQVPAYDVLVYGEEHMEDADARALLAGHFEEALGRWARDLFIELDEKTRWRIVRIYMPGDEVILVQGDGPDLCAALAELLLALPEGAEPFGRSET